MDRHLQAVDNIINCVDKPTPCNYKTHTFTFNKAKIEHNKKIQELKENIKTIKLKIKALHTLTSNYIKQYGIDRVQE